MHKLIEEWNASALKLKAAKAKESQLRKKVIAKYFPDADPGTTNVEFPDCKLSCSYSLKYTIDEATFFEVLKDAKVAVPSTLYRQTYALEKAVYNNLTDKQRLILDGGMIIKENSKSVTMTPIVDAD